MQGQQDGGLVAFRTEACVSWGREAAHCCSQAFLPFWLESGLPLFGISHFCPGHPGFWLWVGGCCDTAWGSLMDFLSCLGPVAMAPSCRAWQGLGLGRKAVGACARPPARSRPRGFLRPSFFPLRPTRCRSFASSPVTGPIALSRWWVQNPLEMGRGPKTSALPPRPCVLPSLPQREPLPRRAGATSPTAFFWKLALSSYCWAATCFLVLLCRTDAFCSEHVDSR